MKTMPVGAVLIALILAWGCGGDDAPSTLTGPTVSADPGACTTGTVIVTNRAGHDLLVRLDSGATRWVVTFGSTTFEDVSVGLHRVSWDAAPASPECLRECIGSAFVDVDGCTARTVTVSP